MKIFTPLNNGFDIKALSRYADEYYVGVIDEEWERLYGGFIGYNTRGFSGEVANFPDWETLSLAGKEVLSCKKEFFLTVNAHNISSSQRPVIKRIISDFKSIGGNGIICSELNALEIAKELGLKVYLSTNFALYSINSVKYLTENYDVDRIILSRDMKMEEIKKIRAATDKEIEVFGQNIACRFSNALCYCTHNTKWRGMCYSSAVLPLEYFGKLRPLSFRDKYEADINHHIYSKYLFENACALCALYDFNKIGIDSIKIVGREFPYERIMQSASVIKYFLEKAECAESREEYQNILFNEKDKAGKINCLWGFSCYYPEIADKRLINGENSL